jgi:magnesium transporter
MLDALPGYAGPAEILHLVRGEPPRRLDALERMPDEGFIWLDFSRDAAPGWQLWARRLLNVEVDRRHIADSLEPAHQSFFDGTPDYDLLIFEGLGSRDDAFPIETHSAALFLFDRLLISVRPRDSVSIARLKQRFADGRARSPGNARVLAQMVLDIMVDRYLAIRDSFTRRMETMQEDLLNPTSPFRDWQQLLTGRREARRLESLCEEQLEALDAWHRDSCREWTNPEETRLRDLTEHVARVRNAGADLERHLEAAVQLYFASTTHRTNEIVRTLTVFSAIFLPLTFIVGIYGMNFQHMPELGWQLAYPALLLVMTLVAGGLLLYFKRRGYF